MSTVEDLFVGIDKEPEKQVVLCDQSGRDIVVAYVRPGGRLVDKLGKRDEKELFVNTDDEQFIRVHIHVMGYVSYTKWKDWQDNPEDSVDYSSLKGLGLEQMEK